MPPTRWASFDPYDTERFCRDLTERYPSLRFDFHAHNDYDLAVANTAAAVRAGFHGVHVTVNGLGERAGNAPLSSTVAVLHDRLGRTTGVDETKITASAARSRAIRASAFPPPPDRRRERLHAVRGLHADGDNKNNL